MTITSSGPKCDVCGNYILLEEFYPFRLKVIKQELHACPKCIEIVKGLDQSLGGSGNWRELPEGPLKDTFKKAQERIDIETRK